jgi:hypothetical protein
MVSELVWDLLRRRAMSTTRKAGLLTVSTVLASALAAVHLGCDPDVSSTATNLAAEPAYASGAQAKQAEAEKSAQTGTAESTPPVATRKSRPAVALSDAGPGGHDNFLVIQDRIGVANENRLRMVVMAKPDPAYDRPEVRVSLFDDKGQSRWPLPLVLSYEVGREFSSDLRPRIGVPSHLYFTATLTVEDGTSVPIQSGRLTIADLDLDRKRISGVLEFAAFVDPLDEDDVRDRYIAYYRFKAPIQQAPGPK